MEPSTYNPRWLSLPGIFLVFLIHFHSSPSLLRSCQYLQREYGCFMARVPTVPCFSPNQYPSLPRPVSPLSTKHKALTVPFCSHQGGSVMTSAIFSFVHLYLLLSLPLLSQPLEVLFHPIPNETPLTLICVFNISILPFSLTDKLLQIHCALIIFPSLQMEFSVHPLKLILLLFSG